MKVIMARNKLRLTYTYRGVCRWAAMSQGIDALLCGQGTNGVMAELTYLSMGLVGFLCLLLILQISC